MDNDILYLVTCMKIRKSPNRHTDFAARGEFNLSSAMYYNDQPPQMMYYSAKRLRHLEIKTRLKRDLIAFIEYANNHMNDEMKIDYFGCIITGFLDIRR